MDFALSPHLRELQDKAHAAAARLRPLPDTRTRAFWTVAAQQGWLDESAHDALTLAVIHQALGQAGLSRGALFAMGAHVFGVALALQSFPTSPAAQHWLPRLRRGQAVGALALTEPNWQSDSADIATTATKVDGGWRLDGTKTFVTNGDFADVLLVNARHSEAASAAFATSVFAISADSQGVRTQEREGQIGLRDAPMATVTLDGVFVPEDALVGRQGQGMLGIVAAMRAERSCILAGFVGAAEHDLHKARQHFERRGMLEKVELSLADIGAQIETASVLVHRGAWHVDHGTDAVRTPAVTKLVVARTLARAAQDLQELVGGAAWCDEMGLARAVTDTMGVLTASGTATMQLRAIASRPVR